MGQGLGPPDQIVALPAPVQDVGIRQSGHRPEFKAASGHSDSYERVVATPTPTPARRPRLRNKRSPATGSMFSSLPEPGQRTLLELFPASSLSATGRSSPLPSLPEGSSTFPTPCGSAVGTSTHTSTHSDDTPVPSHDELSVSTIARGIDCSTTESLVSTHKSIHTAITDDSCTDGHIGFGYGLELTIKKFCGNVHPDFQAHRLYHA